MRTVFALVKKYWKLLLLVVGAVVGLVLLRGRFTNFVDGYKKINEVHDEEVKAIKQARVEEAAARVENKTVLEKTLDAVQKQYDSELAELDSKKKKEIEKIVKEHGRDPVALADELTKITGFRVILPED